MDLRLKMLTVFLVLVLLIKPICYATELKGPKNFEPEIKDVNSTLQLISPQTESLQVSKKRMVKILSIDGGGVRGIIPALLLENLESRLPAGHRIGEYFDIMAGSSAGGILAFMLSTPNIDGNPKYSTAFIASEIEEFSKDVFSRSLWQIFKSVGGWLDAKYNEKSFQCRLKNYFQDTKLSQLRKDVIVPAYDIEKDKTFFFKSSRARNELLHDYYVRDLAYATSAAPTYFRPAQIKDVSEKIELTLIDGGVAANNPTLAAIVYAVELYGMDIDLFVVSMGTGTNYGATNKKIPYANVKTSGKLGWANEIISLLLFTAGSVTDYEAYYVLNFKKPQYYFRFQTILEPVDAVFDDTSSQNIQDLKNYANKLIQQNERQLSYIANILIHGYFPYPEEKPDHRVFR